MENQKKPEPQKQVKFIISIYADQQREIIYSVAMLRILFDAKTGLYSPDDVFSYHVPTPVDTSTPGISDIPTDVLTTCNNIHDMLFSNRSPLSKDELAGMVRGHILSFLAASECTTASSTKLIGVEIFNDIRLLEEKGFLSFGDYSHDVIDVRSSLESMMEVRLHVGKDKTNIMQEIIKIGVLPGLKEIPVSSGDPLYGCYEGLRVYNGILRYGRNK